MEKVTAKRKLKKSFYSKLEKSNSSSSRPAEIKNIHMDLFENDYINGLYKRNGAIKNNNKVKNNDETDFFTRLKKKMLIRLIIQGITMTVIFVFCLSVKYMNLKIVKNSEICKKIIKEFKKNYSKQEIIDYVSSICDRAYFYIDPVIPDNLSQKTVAVFSNMMKRFENNNTVNVYNENKVDIYNEQKNEFKEGKLELTEETVPVTSTSQIENKTLIAIKESNIEFVKPTSGVITSRFGERDPIFSGVESYHYGTDIANVEGTYIFSSIDGKVTVCSTNNETGNYIEVQNGSVTTRYCHLSKQLVKVGDSVKKGDLIGKMGKTGMATGSHLHFEIMYNRERVDAEQVLKLE